jgi:hypothetical protein
MHYRARPPLNRQDHPNSCWAAAISSFSRINSGIPTYAERDLYTTYGVASQGYGLNASGLDRVKNKMATHGCRLDLVSGLICLPYDIEDKLVKSHVVIMWCVGGTDWHANLVYGIDNATISAMETRDGSYRTRPWSHYMSAPGQYLLWRP